jgi:hypothetical protein
VVRAIGLSALVLVLAMLTVACGPPERPPPETIKKAGRLLDDFLEWLGSNQGQDARNAACSTLSLSQGDPAGALSAWAEGPVKIRSTISDFEQLAKDPDVFEGSVSLACAP